MTAKRPMLALLPLLMSTAGHAQAGNFAAPEAPTSQAGFGEDLLPRDEKDRAALLRAVAFDATVYGMAAYLHYEQLYRQVFDRSSGNYTGFNRFAHERNLAGPDYATFKVPNTDTLYSTAWIDLSKGPVEIDIPANTIQEHGGNSSFAQFLEHRRVITAWNHDQAVNLTLDERANPIPFRGNILLSVSKNDLVISTGSTSFDPPDDRIKESHSDVRHDHTDGARAPQPHTLRGAIWPVVQRGDCLLDSFLEFRSDILRSSQNVRDRRGRDTSRFRDIVNGHLSTP